MIDRDEGVRQYVSSGGSLVGVVLESQVIGLGTLRPQEGWQEADRRERLVRELDGLSGICQRLGLETVKPVDEGYGRDGPDVPIARPQVGDQRPEAGLEALDQLPRHR